MKECVQGHAHDARVPIGGTIVALHRRGHRCFATLPESCSLRVARGFVNHKRHGPGRSSTGRLRWGKLQRTRQNRRRDPLHLRRKETAKPALFWINIPIFPTSANRLAIWPSATSPTSTRGTMPMVSYSFAFISPTKELAERYESAVQAPAENQVICLTKICSPRLPKTVSPWPITT